MTVKLPPQPNKCILEQLQALGIQVPAACGGNGTCGKCRVRIIEGHVTPGNRDINIFGKQKCDEGWRLACTSYSDGELTVEIPDIGTPVIAGISNRTPHIMWESETDGEPCANKAADSTIEEKCIIADVGTTTVVCALLNSNGDVLKSQCFLNPQASFGADVISRIKASNDGEGEMLRKAVVRKLREALGMLSENTKNIRYILIAGNTAMLHLLRGYDCTGLAKYPFKPFNLEAETLDAGELFEGDFDGTELFVMPGISAFVGADIVSGIYGLDLDNRQKATLLMDLGTNGEMVLAQNGKLFTASAAAGPAFEGGNISCGMGCVSGAVTSVRINNGTIETETADNANPLGICGSGLLELVSELRRNEIIDEYGTFREEFFDRGFAFAEKENGEPLVLLQKDIRELQLAKGAVRAVAELLLKNGPDEETGTAGETSEVSRELPDIYLAGGFGIGIDISRIKELGFFPENDIISCVGNSCILGLQKAAVGFLNGRKEVVLERLNHIAHFTQEIPVAGESDFETLFFKFMNF